MVISSLWSNMCLFSIKLFSSKSEFRQFRSLDMEEYEINILNLRCPICLDIFKDPYVLPCQANCIACFKCICDLFNCAPKPFSESGDNDELEVIAKCICNQPNISIDRSVPCVGVKRITKNVIIKCKNYHHGCTFFYQCRNAKIPTRNTHGNLWVSFKISYRT